MMVFWPMTPYSSMSRYQRVGWSLLPWWKSHQALLKLVKVSDLLEFTQGRDFSYKMKGTWRIHVYTLYISGWFKYLRGLRNMVPRYPTKELTIQLTYWLYETAFLENCIVPALVKNPLRCTESESSLPYSQGPTTRPYPKLDESSLHLPNLFI
jgi:hypothetical protein